MEVYPDNCCFNRRFDDRTQLKYETDHQIRMMGFQALQKELGIVGLIRFMQQYDLGSGDYVKDREAWQKDYTVDSLTTAIKNQE